MNKPKSPQQEKRDWLDDPRHIDWILWALYGMCGLLFVSDLFYHRHSHFGFEGWFGFNAWYGFLSYCFIVLSAKQLRKILRRDEDYYDR